MLLEKMLLVPKLLLIGLWIVAIFTPVALILMSAIRYKRMIDGISSWAILIAGILLTLLPLNFLYAPVLKLVFELNTEKMAEVLMFLAYVEWAVAYLALLLLGIGLWIQSKRIQGIVATQADHPVEARDPVAGIDRLTISTPRPQKY